jgi:integrase/recombinase XerD
MAILKTLYDEFLADSLIDTNPLDTPTGITRERVKRPTEPIPPEKVRLMLERADLQGRAMLAVLFGTGIRRSELCDLRFGNIMQRGQTIAFRQLRTKGGKFRYIELPAFVSVIMADYLRSVSGSTDDYVFTHRGGKRISGDKLYDDFKRHCARAGVDPARHSPHSARASFACLMDDSGVPLRTIRDALGHASSQTTDIYLRQFRQGNDVVQKLSYG